MARIGQIRARLGQGPRSRSRPLVGRALEILKALPNQLDFAIEQAFRAGRYSYTAGMRKKRSRTRDQESLANV